MYDVPAPCPTCGNWQHPPCALCGVATRCPPDDPGDPFTFCDPCDAELATAMESECSDGDD